MPVADRHEPVLLDRVLALVAPALEAPGSVLVDATLGLGGHTEAILERCPKARVIGIDRDPGALEHARRRLVRDTAQAVRADASVAERLTLVHAVYDELPDVLADLGIASVSGVLFDLGVSSMQLDREDRGFSYAADAPLDMRMDPTAGATAADVVNTYPVEELARVLREYGEERFARRIAQRIVAERAREPFTHSERLAHLVRDAIPAATRRTGGHPAKRTFQALRIEVNDELGALRRALPAAVRVLGVGGRIVVLSYHSLEDRLVKRVLADGSSTHAPPDLPVVPDELRPELRLLTRGAELADEDEVARNPRARPARLRAAERVRAAHAA